MPLSEEELRLLEQMERALVAEDPKLASTMRGTTLRAVARRRAVISALAFVVGLKPDFAIVLQLLGGIWIIQTLPAVLIGLYTRWLNSWALLIGWGVGIWLGTWMVVQVQFKAAPFSLPIYTFQVPAYPAFWALLANLAVALLLTFVFNIVARPEQRDDTVAADYAW